MKLIALVALTLATSAAAAVGGPGVNGRILYTDQADKPLSGQLYASSADGSGRVLLAEDAMNGTWSPDGKRVAFESYRKGDSDLWAVNADATNLKELTFSPGYDGDASWSPDGTRIAFESNRNNATGSDVFTMDADGNNLTRLTTNGSFNGDPAWSPDGTRLAFTSDRGGSKDIWLMNANGSGFVQLTNAPGVDQNPAWSPDGSQIAFDSDRIEPRNLDVWAMNADGSNQHPLAASTHDDALPSWSPDGTRIVFVSSRTGQSLIYTMRPDGADVRLVSLPPGHNATLPSWGIRPAGDTCTIEGTADSDWLIGTPGRDVMCAGSGGREPFSDDTFRAGAGDDLIIAPQGLNDVQAGPGNDVIHSCGFIEGGPGNDRIYASTDCGGALDGGAGDDVIFAGPRQDEIWGGGGRDVIHAGSGPDTIRARDGQRDIVDGGPGRDIAEVDKIDIVRNVEVIRYPKTNSKPGAVQVVSN